MDKYEWVERRRERYMGAGWPRVEANRVVNKEGTLRGGVGRESLWSEESLGSALRERVVEVEVGKLEEIKLGAILPKGCVVPAAELGDEALRPEFFQRAVVWAAQMVSYPRRDRVSPPNRLAMTILRYGLTEGGLKDLVVGMLPKVYPGKGEGMDGRTYGTDGAVDLTGIGRQIAEEIGERIKRGVDAGGRVAGGGESAGVAEVEGRVVEGGV